MEGQGEGIESAPTVLFVLHCDGTGLMTLKQVVANPPKREVLSISSLALLGLPSFAFELLA